MYRNPGASSVLHGVLSGPYSGAPREVSAAKLPRAARQRLADALAGRAEPMPIAHERPSGEKRHLATWGLLAGLVALTLLFAVGFGDPRSSWVLQPRGLAFAYAATTAACASAVLALFRRHARASGAALTPGRYLLPLDIVEVGREDRFGDQLVMVTPLGAARAARTRVTAKGGEDLVVVLEGGREITFALRSSRDGDAAMRRLELAQKLLEDLTYGRDLEKAVVNDAFFDVRVDASWAAVAPGGPTSRKVASRRVWLHTKATSAGVLGAAACLGVLTFQGRNLLSDRALYLRAVRAGTPDQLDRYIAVGRAYRDEARALRQEQEALAQRASKARSRAHDLSPKAEWELTSAERAARTNAAEGCLAAMRARSPKAHPKSARIFASLFERARRTGDTVVPVWIDDAEHDVPNGLPASDHRARMATTVAALERVFSETCPASILRFVATSAPRGEVPPRGITVKLDVHWPKSPTWKLARGALYVPTYQFDVALRDALGAEAESFRLTVPPAEQPTTKLRDRSLFVVSGRPVADGELDPRLPAFASARAFDRLYDELYGLVFDGDPRVPLRESPDEDPFEAR